MEYVNYEEERNNPHGGRRVARKMMKALLFSFGVSVIMNVYVLAATVV